MKGYKPPESLRGVRTHYCGGCGHGIIHTLICEVIDELGIREKTIAVAPVGCAVIAYDYWDFDCTEAAHGRPPAVGTGIKRTRPGNIVFTYQGDGDLAAIGTAEIIHAANRSENITVFFVNNGVYGMTSGQMAPTTLAGQKTATTPWGRDVATEGGPIHMCELLSVIEGVRYVERVSVHSPAMVNRTKKGIRKAFLTQIRNKGFSMLEILSPCPVCWYMCPVESLKWIEERMVPEFPLRVFKDETGID